MCACARVHSLLNKHKARFLRSLTALAGFWLLSLDLLVGFPKGHKIRNEGLVSLKAQGAYPDSVVFTCAPTRYLLWVLLAAVSISVVLLVLGHLLHVKRRLWLG